MNKKLAKIRKASLEIKERGILTFLIYVDYEEGCSQGIGGLALDRYNKEKDCRVGTAYGCEMIRRILLAFNVNDFCELAGMHLWVLGAGTGLEFSPKGIEPLSVDSKQEAVIFKEIADELLKGRDE